MRQLVFTGQQERVYSFDIQLIKNSVILPEQVEKYEAVEKKICVAVGRTDKGSFFVTNYGRCNLDKRTEKFTAFCRYNDVNLVCVYNYILPDVITDLLDDYELPLNVYTLFNIVTSKKKTEEEGSLMELSMEYTLVKMQHVLLSIMNMAPNRPSTCFGLKDLHNDKRDLVMTLSDDVDDECVCNCCHNRQKKMC